MRKMIGFTTAIAALALATTTLAAPGSDGRKQRKGPPNDGFGRPEVERVLNDKERKQLHAAMAEVRDDPRIIEARKALEEAHKAMRKAMHDALLEADPSLAPILDKIKDADRPRLRPFGPFAPAAGRKGPPSNDLGQ